MSRTVRIAELSVGTRFVCSRGMSWTFLRHHASPGVAVVRSTDGHETCFAHCAEVRVAEVVTQANGWRVLTARCDDRGGLLLEGRERITGAEFFVRVAHHEPVSDRYDFTNCAFGPGARERLECLRTQNRDAHERATVKP